MPNRTRKLVGKLEIAAHRSLFGQVGLNRFGGREPKPNRQHQVLELGTRVRPPELSNQVVVGRARAGEMDNPIYVCVCV